MITIPIFLYIAIGLAVIGIIARFFKYKFKFKFGKMFFGLGLLGLSLIIGGLNVKENEYRLIQFIMMLFISIGLLFLYSLLVSNTKKVDFDIVAFIMHIFALILILQEIIYYIVYPEHLIEKKLDLGWGVTNNLALMYLFTMPFFYYSAIVNKNYKRYLFVLFTVLQFMAIVFTYSRGCILIGGLGALIMILSAFNFFKDDLKRYLLFLGLSFAIPFIFLFSLTLFKENYLEIFKSIVIDGIHFDRLNGRLSIYETWIKDSMDYPLLGHGIYYPFVYQVSTLKYQWGHCTFLHALYTTGIIGTLLLTYHMVEKYYGLIKKINIKKFTLLFAFALSGFYGLFDISYFYINYMIVLLIILVLSDDYMERLIKFNFIKDYAN